MKKIFLIALPAMMIIMACQNATQKNELNDKSSIDVKHIIKSYHELFNNHDWEKMAAMYSETPEMKDPAFGVKSIKISQSDIIKKYKELNMMIPDVHDSVISMYPSGDNDC